MQVIVVGKCYAESFTVHIAETLVNLGHYVRIFDPGIQTQVAKNPFQHKLISIQSQLYFLFQQTKIGRKLEFTSFKKFVSRDKVDLVISCHDFLNPTQVKWLKKSKDCKVVLWFPDAISNFGRAMFLDSEYDALFFKEPFIVNILRNEFNKKAYYLPEACNPLRHKKVHLIKEDYDKYNCEITTAGNMHTARAAFFKNLQEYDVKIWGNPAPSWMDTAGIYSMIQNTFVSNEEKSKAFACSKIVVNNMHPTEIHGANVRLFEIAATGSFQICNYRKGLEELYEIDNELIVFKTINEFHDKVKYYLANDKLRKDIADRAYLRTIRDHTYENRLQQMIKIVFHDS